MTIVAYIPPSYDAEQTSDCLEYITLVLQIVKSRYESPYILLGGDFNQKPLWKVLVEFHDLKAIRTAPTRGTRDLDKLVTNFNTLLSSHQVIRPVVNAQGTESDHCPVLFEFDMPIIQGFKWEQYSYRRRTEDGDLAFGKWLTEQD